MQPDESKRLDALSSAFNQLLQNQDRLEQRLVRLEKLFPPEPEPVTSARAVVEEPVPRNVRREAEPPAPVESVPEIVHAVPEEATLETKVGLTVVNRIGAITLVLGVAFFFKWAVDNNWIGPAGRVILGLIAGFATLGVGDFIWRKRQQVFAQGITAAGIGIVYLALYAAFDFYHLIPQAAAFVLMALTTVMAAALALRYNSFAIAALGLAAGFATPLLLSTGEDHPWFLFSYLLLLNIVATELAKKRDWKGLETIGFIATVLIYAGWFLGNRAVRAKDIATLAPLVFCAQRWRSQTPLLFAMAQLLTAFAMTAIWLTDELRYLPLALVVAAGGLLFGQWRGYQEAVLTAFLGFWFSYAFHLIEIHEPLTQFVGVSLGFLLFFAWSWWYLIIQTAGPSALPMSVFALNGVVYFAHCYYLLNAGHHLWLGPLAALIAAGYLGFGVFLRRRTTGDAFDNRPVLLALGVALGFLTLAIPIQFSGFTITIAWAMQGAALSWIGYRLHNDRAIMAALFLFALVSARLLLFELETLPDPHFYSLLLNSRFLTFAVSAVAMLFAAWWGAAVLPPIALACYYAGHISLLLGLSLEVLGWAGRWASVENLLSVETIGISILFALYAVVLVSVGVATRSALNRISGLGLTGIVILKLYLFDVWQLSRPYQISAFVILGILLLSTSFLYSHFRRLIETWWKDDKTPT
jgi:uncharacterized membrane protein